MTPDSSDTSLQLPSALQARLDAAGVSDDASLQAALEADPELRAEFEAFLQENPELLAAAQMSALLQAFAAVQDSEQMLDFWRQVPTEQEAPLMAAVETWIAQAQAAGDADAVNHLTPRLESFRQVRAAAQATTDASGPTIPPELRAKLDAAGVSDDASLQAALEADPELRAEFEAFLQENPELLAAAQMSALLQAFAAVQDSEQMLDFWRQVPTEQEAPLMAAVESWIAQAQAAGDADAVNHLTPRLESFRQVQAAAAQAQQTPPVVQALGAFFQAEDDAAATAVFEAQRVLLQPYEAQQMLDALAAQPPDDADAATRQRIVARRDLLRRLRGAAPAPLADARGADDTPLAPRLSHLHGDLYQAERQYINSAHAESGGVATVVNHIFVQSVTQRWSRPTPPALRRDAVARPHEMAQVKAALAARGGVAITGETTAPAPAPALHHTPTLAMQGMAGVGKTVLAYLLAQELDAAYPDGVIWETLGPDFTDPAQTQAVLRRWVGYATNFFELDDNARKAFTFEAAAVRTLLAEHAHLLVVLDNVWSLDAIKPLQEALPRGAHLVVTTRSAEIARGLGAGRVAIGRLSETEAVALVGLRLGWQPDRENAADAWVFALVEGVGAHALGLDVALGVLQREGGDDPGAWQAAASRLLAAVRRGELGDLTLGDDLDHDVQAVLYYSYRTLDAPARERFRRLGAFALDANFTTAEAAAVWACAVEDARRTLVAFANAALVERDGDGGGRWRQHALLRGLALALLRKQGEQEDAAAAHARAYAAAMQTAEAAQRYHELLPAMPQLRHAMTWALANDLELALDIAAASANLQKQFGLVAEAGAWSEAILAAAQRRATPATLARAWGHRGNRLSELATLPGEDRRQRLDAALAAYDDALRFIRPDNAPLDYAQTQNNRANILSELATLPGEDRRQRLDDALAAYDDALRFRRPDNAPLAYATTQNNRANILSALATLPGEDRRQRLDAALAAYADALRFRRPDNAPLDYAQTQNNRALLLSALATLPGEDRRQRLDAALAAYDDALRFIRPDNAPLAYAQTQNNRANILSELATLPGEDRRQRLDAALAAYDAALRFRRPDNAPLDYATTQNNRGTILSALATLPGEDRRQRLDAALAAYDDALRFRRPDNAPLDYATTQGNRAILLADLSEIEAENQRVRQSQSLQAAVEAWKMYHKVGHIDVEWAQSLVFNRRKRFGADVFDMLWAELGLGDLPGWLLQTEADGWLAADAAQRSEEEQADHAAFRARLHDYGVTLQSADAETPDAAVWQAITALGEELLAEEMHGWPGMDWAALREQVASDYNTLGNALDSAGDKPAALAAFERAIALQPDFAMWRRNQAGTLIELGRLTDARAAIAAARALAPDAPRLADLEADLVAALGES